MSEVVENVKFIHYPIAFIDYIWVIFIYTILSFISVSLIESFIMPPFDKEKVKKETNLKLASKVFLQIALLGFIAIFLVLLLENIPSPVNKLFEYNQLSSLGHLIRNPAIIVVLLFFLSKKLQENLLILFNRYDKNP